MDNRYFTGTGKLFWALLLLAGSTITAQGTLFISPSEVSLAAPQGSASRAQQILTIGNTGASTGFSATVRYLSPVGDWLSVSVGSGNSASTITAFASARSLTPGVYFAQIVVSSSSSSTFANVRFTVGSADARGVIVPNPSGLTFFSHPSSPQPDPQTISVTSATGGAGAVQFTAIANSAGWLSVSPFPASTPARIDILPNPVGLAPGIYTGSITLIPTGGAAPTVVPVALQVAATSDVQLTVSHPAVIANYQPGAAAPPLQFVTVSASSFSLSYSASTTTSWLRLTNAAGGDPATSVSGATPGSFGIGIDPGGLAPGTYVGLVTVSSYTTAPITVPVTLFVGNQPALNAQPSSLRFDAVPQMVPRLVNISTTSPAPMAFTTSIGNGAAWLKVSPASGTTTSSTTLSIVADPGGLLDGTYNSSVLLTVAGTNSTLTIPVRLVVDSGSSSIQPLTFSLPSVELTGVTGLPDPQQQIIVDSPTPQDFSAVASSNSGWLFVDPFTGTATGKLTISVKAAAVPATGDYTGSVTVTSLNTGQATTIPVTYHYRDQAILATPAAVTVTQTQWNAAPPPQTLQITSNAPASISVTSSAPWIRVTPSFSSAPATLTVSVDPKGLPPGPISGSIEITGPRNSIKVPVLFTVADPPGPNVTPTSITANYQLGGPVLTLPAINVSSTGQSVGFTAIATTQTGVRWLSINTTSGSTPATLTATIHPDLLVPGLQSGVITISSPDGLLVRTIPVNLTVSTSGITVGSISNGATFVPAALCPGQIIAITGTSLGPNPGIGASPTVAGVFDSTLAGVRVLFDGIPAPLLYAGANQINAVVPYGIAGRATVKVQVTQGQDKFSVPVEVKVVDSAPGLFTTQGSGRGQAAAMNQDGTANSQANPAARGSFVTIFGTGEGQTDPSGQDGRIIVTDLRRPLLPVQATIGGRQAEVAYLGSAPGMVSGLFQANIRVPDEVGPGVMALQVQIGAALSQSGVQIAVK